MLKTNTEKYKGIIVPMITPFTAELKIDTNGVQNVVNHLIEHRCTPFILGTTGEALSISNDEKLELVKQTVKAVNGRSLVYAGISGNSYSETVLNSKKYLDAGADVLVAHLPGYYPLDDSQILHYFEQLANEVPLPLILYNMPLLAHHSMSHEVIEQLSYHDNIVGFKESERGDERLDKSLELWSKRNDFSFQLGWAGKSAYGLLKGLDGIVPSSGNIVPQLYSDLYQAAKNGNEETANQLQELTNEISAFYQQGHSLSYSLPKLKAMMKAVNLCEANVLPPMTTLNKDDLAKVKSGFFNQYVQYIQ